MLGNPSNLFSSSSRKKILISAAIGNMLEIYDFALYGYFAPIISVLFFPHTNKFISLLATFGVFAVGFLMRPLGAILFGYFGDRIGRKKALAGSIILMAIPTTLIGLLPTYHQVGIFSGILLLCCRLLQGLATGGEFTGAIIYMTEHAPNNKRGLQGSWAMVSTFVGFLIGSGLSALFSNILSAESLNLWGWRVLFIMGFALGIVGLYLRLLMPETPSFLAMQTENKIVKNPIFSAFKEEFKSMIIIVGLNSLPAMSYYLAFVYLSSYFVIYIHVPLHTTLLINTISMLILVAITPCIGLLSDRIGRKPILLTGAFGFLIFSYPLFLLMQLGNFTAILVAQLGLTLLVSCIISVIPATLVELVTPHIRYSTISFPFNLSSALFGGTFPLIATFLIERTGSPLSPSFCLIFMAVIMMVTIFFMKESYLTTEFCGSPNVF
jgi:MHS family proline/betaine transporter-like MFS transporter